MDPTELSVPLEVLERIFRLAFEPTNPPSFTPAPSPPRGTSHLLLVSRGVRELCLPHFWRAVSIAQPSDWVTLFDKDTGLFNTGEEGKRRWESVEELNIVVEAEIPASMVPDYKPEHTGGPSPSVAIHALNLPSYRRLSRLVLHHVRAEDNPRHQRWQDARMEDECTILQLVMLLRPPESAQYGSTTVSISVHQGEVVQDILPESPAEHARRIVHDVLMAVKYQIEDARRDHLNRVLRSFQPTNLRISHACLDMISTALFFREGRIAHPDLIEICGAGVGGTAKKDTLASVDGIWTKGARCSLIGFSEERLDAVETWLKEIKASPVSARWTSVWSWTRADGSEFTIDFATKDEA